ncbi:hypothetical protein LACDD01_02180 [Lactococcus sp. DD01]|nr:hypothetical protein LACDD01_02180 [Lactococcus sp. DD01]
MGMPVPVAFLISLYHIGKLCQIYYLVLMFPPEYTTQAQVKSLEEILNK